MQPCELSKKSRPEILKALINDADIKDFDKSVYAFKAYMQAHNSDNDKQFLEQIFFKIFQLNIKFYD